MTSHENQQYVETSLKLMVIKFLEYDLMGLMHITSQFFSSSAAYCMKSRLGGIA